ncbi:ABC transporter substrate-binding protein [Humibacter antri]
MNNSEFDDAFRIAHARTAPSFGATTRRDFLRLGGLAATAIAAGGLLTGCASGASSAATTSAAAGGDFGAINMQLGWIKNMQFCGEYMASQRTYYTKSGLDVTLVSGGAAATSAEASISTGKSWTGTSKPLAAAQAIAKGVKVKIIGAVMQQDGHVIISPAGKPLKSPKDLIGKKVGVSLHTMPDFLALLKVNHIDPSQVHTVPVQFDPSPLVHGEVDAWDGYSNNEPVTLAKQGFQTHSFKYADYGLPTVAQVLEVASDSITKERDKVKAFLTAEIQGWRDAIKDPDQAVKYCVDIYGKSLNLTLADQLAAFKATIPLIVNDQTKKHGLMTLSAESMASTVASIKSAGTDVDAKDLFDLSILDEVYAAHPEFV